MIDLGQQRRELGIDQTTCRAQDAAVAEVSRRAAAAIRKLDRLFADGQIDDEVVQALRAAEDDDNLVMIVVANEVERGLWSSVWPEWYARTSHSFVD